MGKLFFEGGMSIELGRLSVKKGGMYFMYLRYHINIIHLFCY